MKWLWTSLGTCHSNPCSNMRDMWCNLCRKNAHLPLVGLLIQELHEDNASLQDVDALGFIHFIVEAIHSLNLGDAFLPLKVLAESEGEGGVQRQDGGSRLETHEQDIICTSIEYAIHTGVEVHWLDWLSVVFWVVCMHDHPTDDEVGIDCGQLIILASIAATFQVCMSLLMIAHTISMMIVLA